MTPILIGLAGPIGSGKSSVATHLHLEHGWHAPVAFADPMKDGICAMFGMTRPQLEEIKRAEKDLVSGVPMRRALQTLGTEWGRSLHADLWVEAMRKRINQLMLWEEIPGIAIDDVRFENEATFIRAHGGILIHVRNGDPRFPRNSHVSEKPLAIADNDLVIENTGTTNDLFRRVDKLMARISGFAMAYPAREA